MATRRRYSYIDNESFCTSSDLDAECRISIRDPHRHGGAKSDEDDGRKKTIRIDLYSPQIRPEEDLTILKHLTQTGNHNLLSSAIDDFGDELTYQKYLSTFFVHIFKHVKEGSLNHLVDTVH
ncbi:Hypothetical predicted protein [Mytilus galloprovincialis]|uniref:Uncharacterized protein n=1 Tax=Mytilus galloprovincialis TaxID=29158 RepID=A0A8B6E5G9_MYTGA|nr:Hypothetical predicted protein [Mytilus galloprovincialis]